MASWIDAYLPMPGDQWWGSKKLNEALRATAQQVDSKAPADHEHTAGGSTVITRGDDTARSAAGTTLHVRDDIDAVERVVDGVVVSSLATKTDVLAAPLPLANWQTDPDQYTVLKQDAHDSAGKGKDLFYKYVFPAGVLSIMYSQIMLPFSGYDLQLILPYRMSTSASGGVFWQVCWKEVSTNEADAELTAWAAFFDSLDNITDTPSATANQRNLISGQNLVIPSTAYNANGTLKLALMRQGTHENDTHAGDAEVYDSIVLVPVLP